MKLLLDVTVEHPDAGYVLRTLQYYLREVSLETVRTEEELIVYGLGPSFRTMNPKDKTIVRATSQSLVTTLHAEANFLPSALVGDVAQDDIVRSKIERAFELLKTELSYDTASRRTTSRTLQTVPTPHDEAVEAVAAMAEASPLPPVEADVTSPAPIDRAPDPPPTSSVEVKPEPKPEPKPETQPASKRSEPAFNVPLRSTAASSVAEVKTDASSAKRRRSAILLLLPLLVLLLAAASYLQHRYSTPSSSPAEAASNTASVTMTNKAAAPTPAPPVAVVTPVEPAPAVMPTDIKAWVQTWAAAISTRDVQTQLGFYETPLNRYFLTPNVSREQLLKNKQAEIDGRKGVWTLRAEDVVVQKRTSTNAVVFLTKHITVELPSSTTREERIKAQLKLKMVDGEWKITSERTVG